MSEEITYLINRLEEALDRQSSTEGEIASTPDVTYCFDCDEITVDERPQSCVAHHTVSSDGCEHAGIQDTLRALRYLENGGCNE